jgi:hypothetical protein
MDLRLMRQLELLSYNQTQIYLCIINLLDDK